MNFVDLWKSIVIVAASVATVGIAIWLCRKPNLVVSPIVSPVYHKLKSGSVSGSVSESVSEEVSSGYEKCPSDSDLDEITKEESVSSTSSDASWCMCRNSPEWIEIEYEED